MSAAQPRIFVVAGMPRTGTTFLYQRFQEHPGVFCPYRKETNYFTVNHDRGEQWFSEIYREMPADAVGADLSPACFLDDAAIGRIRDFTPRPRVILGVRRASEWSLSWYNQVLAHHWKDAPDFEEFLTGYTYHIGSGTIWQDLRRRFVTRRIEEYRETFGDELLLYDYATFREEPLAVMQAIEQFVGVPGHFEAENFRNEVINAGSRRNVSLLTYLLSREQFVDFVGRVVPRRWVQAVRNAYVRLGREQPAPRQDLHEPEDVATAGEFFAEDDAWIDETFAAAGIQLGSGRPFPETNEGAARR